jgi:retron-type reverse transcriptase
MVIIVQPKDNPQEILERIREFLATRGMRISEQKTRITAATDGFDFLGWHFKVQSNRKFRTYPSEDNYQKFRQKVKNIVRRSDIGSSEKAEKLAPLVRGWRNYHRFCQMKVTENRIYYMQKRTFNVFNGEKNNTKISSKILLDKAFPKVSYSENSHIIVQGEKSPYDNVVHPQYGSDKIPPPAAILLKSSARNNTLD